MFRVFKPFKGQAIGIWAFLCLLTACSNTRSWTLSYEATGAPEPELVLVFRLDGDEGSGELKANFDTSSDTVDFQPEALKAFLWDCADQIATNQASKDSCVSLGEHLGQTLFRGEPRLFSEDNLSLNTNVSIGVSGATTRFFVIFMYYVTNPPSVDERCFKLVEAIRQSDGFAIEGAGTDTNISLEVARVAGDNSGAVAERGCFPVDFN